MESKHYAFSQNLNAIKLSSQPIQISTNYLPFYSPVNKAPTYTIKTPGNQEIFKHQILTSPKNLSGLLKQTGQNLEKKPQESQALTKFLQNGQNNLTQRDPIKKDLHYPNGSLSERSIVDKKKWLSFSKYPQEINNSCEKENQNTLNVPKAIQKIEKFTKNISKGDSFPMQINSKKTNDEARRIEGSSNLSKQDIIWEENSEKINFLNQKFEISKTITQQTPKTNNSETPNEEKKISYHDFLHELKSHKNEIVDLKKQTVGLKEKVNFLETQIIESDRRKKLDELNELLDKAKLENQLIRKKTKNRELKLTQGEDFNIQELKNKNTKSSRCNLEKNKLEFKKLLQKTDLSKLISFVECGNKKGKINSERNSKNSEDLNSILKRKMSSNVIKQNVSNNFKEDQINNNKKEIKDSNQISESLNTLKKRLAKFLNNYENRKKME